ncbi:uncharacterized protein V1516DRAFT_672695 [Lipomyces oligophaga]|uniref:uncharacterized protein n=1 Tax=Lipomyces oligophaga TaxID=45792 RepID=UPI0034CD4C4A
MAPTVSSPTNRAERDVVTDQLMHLYAMFRAFGHGKMPTNDQFDIAVNSLLASEIMDPQSSGNSSLSENGKLILSDLADAIQKTKILWLNKNKNHLMQEFLYHASNARSDTMPIKESSASESRDSATLYDRSTIQDLKTLGNLVITNGQFRSLLNDAVTLLRDMLFDARIVTSKAAGDLSEKLQPDDSNRKADNSDLHMPTKEEIQNSMKSAKKAVKKDLSRQQDKAREDTKQYLSKKVPKEKQDEILRRLKNMIAEIQGQEDYQNAIDSLLRMFETHQATIVSTTKEKSQNMKLLYENDHVQQARCNLKLLIERFANNTGMDFILDTINKFYISAEQDPKLRRWFGDLDSFLHRCLKEPGYCVGQRFDKDFASIRESGRERFESEHKEQVEQLRNQLTYYVGQFKKDPLNRKTMRSFKKLGHDLGTQSDLSSGKKILEDVMTVVLPQILGYARYVPLPRIEYSDDSIDAVVENLIIESNNLFPNIIDIHNQTSAHWRRGQRSNKNMQGGATFSASGIQCDLKDVGYYINKKKGLLSMSDIGLADIFLGDQGLSFTIALSTASARDQNAFFKVDNVNVSIKHMDIRLRKSTHSTLFKIFRPLLMALAKPAIKVILQKQIRMMFNQLDQTAYKVHQEKKRVERAHAQRVAAAVAAEAAEDEDVEAGGVLDEDSSAKVGLDSQESAGMPSMYALYAEAIRNEVARMQESRKRKADHSTARTNVTTDLKNSMFKNVRIPKGVTSNLAAKYDRMINEGEGWTSAVFNIGSAPKSAGVHSQGVSQNIENSGGEVSEHAAAVPLADTQATATLDEKEEIFPTMRTSNPERKIQPMRV